MKTTIRIFFPLLALFSLFAAGREANAVIPPPDGGYPNFTTAEGDKALFSLTSGAANTAVGWFSLKSVTTGSFNAGVGAGTLVLNTGDENTAVGAAALLLNTANGNTAVGSRALLNNTTGGTLENILGFDVGPNVAVGQQALESNTVASANTAVGYQALQSFTTGPTGFEQIGFCTAVGFEALANANGNGIWNTAVGAAALLDNTIGANNTANGARALFRNTTGTNNTASGFSSLVSNTTGGNNTANGTAALLGNTTGANNTAVGHHALAINNGSGNTAIGAQALQNNTSGSFNIVLVGGQNLTTGDFNIDIGNDGVAGESNTVRIGNPLHSRAFIAGINGATVAGGTAVFINSEGQLGTTTSSARFKQDIHDIDSASEAILALRPVTFRYKPELDPNGIPQFGLVAEEVEKVNPDLIIRDGDGKPYTVRYEQINAMLLNEFLKEHKKVEKLEATVADLAAELRQVKTQVQTNSPILRVAAKNP